MSNLPDHQRSTPSTPGTESDSGDATPSFATASTAGQGDPTGQEDDDTDQTVISDQLPIEPVHSLSSLRPRELGHLLEGRRLDHFQVEEFIGGGGMGAVFRARDTLLGRTVALKVLAAGAAGNDETRQRFRNEAQSAARLDHPNIARVHYVGEDQGFNYIVFEFLQGKNLRDLVAGIGPLPVADALRFTLQIAEALAHAWQRDLVHRDIKPSNVLATPEGQVKLVDMGLARLRDVTAPTEDLTASGMTLGTFDYISPEQARDPRHADSRSDIYSLGCTLYYMLCGRPPFQGGTAVQKLLMHQSDAPPNPREFRPDLPAGVEILLKRMLAKSPDDRFQNPAELIAAIATLADQLGIAIHPTTTVRLTVTGQGSNPLAGAIPWLVPAVLLLACVFLIDYVDRTASSRANSDMFSPIVSPPFGAESPRKMNESGISRSVAERPEAVPPETRGDQIDGSIPFPETGPGPASDSDVASQRMDQPPPSSPSSPQDGATSESESASPGGLPVVSWLLEAPRWLAERFHLNASLEGLPPGVEENVETSSRGRAFVNTTRQREYTSLAEACESAEDGDVLEIRQDGPILLDRRSLPLRVTGRSITLRGARGKWPVLRVVANGNPRSNGRPSLFSIAAGRLSVQNLEIELVPEFPRGGLGGWKLFELNAGAAVKMDRCRMDIEGAVPIDDMRDHDEFFVAVGDTTSIGEPASAASQEPVRIELTDIVVRGGDSLVAVDGDMHVSLNVDNGFLVLRGCLYDGIQRVRGNYGASRITLNHVTADVGGGALRIKDIGRMAWVEVSVHSSIFVGTSNRALVEQEHVSGSATREVPLVWQGDGNVYEAWPYFFRQQATTGDGLLLESLSQWQSYWRTHETNADQQSSDTSAVWVDSPPDTPAFEREPADYFLDDSGSFLPPQFGGDASPPGTIIDWLPKGTGYSRRPSLEAR